MLTFSDDSWGMARRKVRKEKVRRTTWQQTREGGGLEGVLQFFPVNRTKEA
jgi:hypothetical protein